MTDILPEVVDITSALSDQFTVTPATKAINIHPVSVNKGSGLQWLAEVTGIEPAQMGGVGDSAGDVDFLRLVGHPAAPANATSDVKEVARYVSSQVAAAGLHDILNHWRFG